jgi:hypothetical protein
MVRSCLAACCIALALRTGPLAAQTTQGLITGRVRDALTGDPIAGARITAARPEDASSVTATSDETGVYLIALVSPGVYRVQAARDPYQPKEFFGQVVGVAARLDIDFALRPATVQGSGANRLAVLDKGRYVHVFGADLRVRYAEPVELVRGTAVSMQPSISYVISARELQQLPLAGRDVYTTIAFQPGIVADVATGRGIGASLTGRRPTASNFLLDGIENNNYLITGPLTIIPPEAVQEYRVSTGNFSAEYGRTSGYIANVVTRAGSARWHGLAWVYGRNEALNANDFQRNLSGQPRQPVRETQTGISAGGRAPRNVFLGLSGEYLRFRNREPQLDLKLPVVTSLSAYTDAGSAARELLTRFPPPSPTQPEDPSTHTAIRQIAPTSSLNRHILLPRIDYHPGGGAHRLFVRAAVNRLDRPDFVWTPYREFITPLDQRATSVAGGFISSLGRMTNEVRTGWNVYDLRLDRRWPEVPTLASRDDTILPGSPASYSIRNRSRNIEILDNLVRIGGKHIIKFGGEYLGRFVDGYLTPARDAYLQYSDFPFGFATDSAEGFYVGRSKLDPNRLLTNFDRTYRVSEWFAYAEDTIRVRQNLTINAGLRYEFSGAPRNTGASKDVLVELGGSGSFQQRLADAELKPGQSGDQPLFASDRNNLAVRLGASWQPSAQMVVRGSYGVFYDRPFDNLWQTVQANDFLETWVSFGGGERPIDYRKPVAEWFQPYAVLPYAYGRHTLTLYQPGMRTGYLQSWFAGIQYAIGPLSTEVNLLGSVGRKLTTTDVVNRGATDASLRDISYRANQGKSVHNGMTALARYQAGALQAQAAYTFSRARDNQTDPLFGEFLSLQFTSPTASQQTSTQRSGFVREGDSNGDWGSSDFDQRHNFAAYGTFTPGGRLRGWELAAVAAARSGLPYSVLVPPGEGLINVRANVVSGNTKISEDAPGGQLLLNEAAFSIPPAGQNGNLPRNAFHGPGFVTFDLSVGRRFPVRRLGESAAITVRADFYNVLNHANLGNPDSVLTSEQQFGLARYGRSASSAGLSILTPLNETARQVQLMLRVSF